MARRFSANHLFARANLSLPLEAQADALSQDELEAAATGKLEDRYVVPPFSVFNTHSGHWQARKRAYLSLGIQSELGRGEGVTWGDSAEITEAGLNYYRKRKRDNSPGGSPRPATKRGADGHTVRGDGTGQVLYGHRAQKNDVMAFKGPVTDPASLARRYGPRPHSNSTGHRDLRPGRDGSEEYKGGDAWLGGRKANAAIGGSPMPLDRKKLRRTSGGKERSIETPIDLFSGKEPEEGVASSGTSIFDPVLCELMYRWFCPPTGIVLDPFAGGSVRGIIAALWGRGYVGVDLRPEQVEANLAQARTITPNGRLKWYVGDSRDLETLVPSHKFDFLFTCPPYYNLELYSYDPADLSNALDYRTFRDDYADILTLSAERLRDNRFAAIVVGNFRDGKSGGTIDFVGDTIRICEKAGLMFYNEAILVTAIGSLPLRTRQQFRATRKMGKTHQQVLIFVKGNPRKAATAVRGD